MGAPTLAIISISQEAGFDLSSCWDCPISLSEVVGQVIVLILLVAIGLYWSGKPGKFLPLIGTALLALMLLVPLMFASTVPRWGVIRSDAPPALYDPGLIRAFYLSVEGVEAVVIWFVVRKRRKAAQQAAGMN